MRAFSNFKRVLWTADCGLSTVLSFLKIDLILACVYWTNGPVNPWKSIDSSGLKIILFLGSTRSRKNFNAPIRSEEHTSELQSQSNLVCRLLLEKKKKKNK